MMTTETEIGLPKPPPAALRGQPRFSAQISQAWRISSMPASWRVSRTFPRVCACPHCILRSPCRCNVEFSVILGVVVCFVSFLVLTLSFDLSGVACAGRTRHVLHAHVLYCCHSSRIRPRAAAVGHRQARLLDRVGTRVRVPPGRRRRAALSRDVPRDLCALKIVFLGTRTSHSTRLLTSYSC
jgi:hypothetical protein